MTINKYIIILIILCLLIITYLIICNTAENFTNTITENTIPKIIIQTWKTKDIPDRYKSMVDSIKKFNLKFEYLYFDDNDIVKFLEKHYPTYLITYTKLPIVIQKIDFFRYIAVYHYGGFYFDLDMEGFESIDDDLLLNDAVFPVDQYIHDYKCIDSRFTPYCEKTFDKLLGQYAFGAKPKNEFIKLLIDNIHHNINKINKEYDSMPDKNIYENYVYRSTGPDYVTNIYLAYNNQKSIKILDSEKSQYFGKYAAHRWFGTWK